MSAAKLWVWVPIGPVDCMIDTRPSYIDATKPPQKISRWELPYLCEGCGRLLTPGPQVYTGPYAPRVCRHDGERPVWED